MNKKTVLYSVVAVIVLAVIWWAFRGNSANAADITAKVRKGRFDVVITVTGELRAKTQTDVVAPMGLRSAGIYQIKINDLIPEGTIVKPGDYVAQLEGTEVMNKLNEEYLNVQKKESEYSQTELDTAISLREARDEVENYKYELRQKELEKEQSIYEAPSIQQQVEIAWEKAARALKQKEDTYKNKKAQAVAKMNIVASELTKARNKMKIYEELMQQLTITSPKGGMIIYAKDWNGRKRVVGSSINMWDPDVANVPDLTQMEVISYVNEVDIQKVKPGQKVDIGLDADPAKKLEGKVLQVASIGEQRPNQNSKVFEVVIDVLTRDSTLRPAMTTSCNILFNAFDNALMVPVEAINVAGNRSYVYKMEGGSVVRRQVIVEATNSKDAYVKHGLEENETVYLKDLTDTSDMKWVLLPDSLSKPPVKAPEPSPGGDTAGEMAAASTLNIVKKDEE